MGYLALEKVLEDFIKNELKSLEGSNNESYMACIRPEHRDHYRGVIDGQIKACQKILTEIRRLRYTDTFWRKPCEK